MKDLHDEIKRLTRMNLGQLHDEYEAATGEIARSNNRVFLIKRIAWRRQADQQGDLSLRARAKATELAREKDLRVRPAREVHVAFAEVTAEDDSPSGVKRPERKPLAVGTTLSRDYRGARVSATVLAKGFEYNGVVFPSLSAVAKAVTGSHWNGRLFFGLSRRGETS